MSDDMMMLFLVAAIAAVVLAWMDGRWRILNGVWRGFCWAGQRWKYFAITFGAGSLFYALTSHRREEEFFMMGLLALAIMAVLAWAREVMHLMVMSDDSFPGKSDKLVWGLMLIFLAPIGAIMFHRYRTKNFSARKPASYELS